MKTVIAADSFKGSLSSLEAAAAIERGIRRVRPDDEIYAAALADGGEGTAAALCAAMGAARQTIVVTGPLETAVECTYGIDWKHQTAVMEMSAAAGLTLAAEAERNPLHTTTYGVGQMIRDAIYKGCRRMIVGIGGSATNDGGAGMLQALGYGLLDGEGKQIPFGAKGLKRLAAITEESVIPELRECCFHIACDVTNPLLGKTGCSIVYGPQKGADGKTAEEMDLWMRHYAQTVCRQYPQADPNQAGCGAAGGLGFAFLTFTNAVLESGIEIVAKETGLEERIQGADLVITGEGRMDGQSVSGKAPVGIARIAKKYGKPVIALVGSAARDAAVCNREGIDAIFPIVRECLPLREAMNPDCARKNLEDTAEQVMRLWNIGCR